MMGRTTGERFFAWWLLLSPVLAGPLYFMSITPEGQPTPYLVWLAFTATPAFAGLLLVRGWNNTYRFRD